MKKEDGRVPRSTRAEGSMIDARSSSSNAAANWQNIRPTEDRLTAHELTGEDILNWKKKFREVSGFSQATIGVIGTLNAALNSKLGCRFRTIKQTRPDDSIMSELLSLSRFVLHTKPEIMTDPRLEDKYKIAYQEFLNELKSLKLFFNVLISPLNEPEMILDDISIHFLEQNYQKVVKTAKVRLHTSTFWKKHIPGRALSNYQLSFVRGIQERTATATSILLSHGYYLSRHLSALTVDQQSHESLGNAWSQLSECAKFIEDQRLKFAEIGIKVNPLEDIPAEQVDEATELWQELIS